MSNVFHDSSYFNPTKTDPATQWIGGYIGPRAGLEDLEKIKISAPCRESKHDSSFVEPVA
jgi:hypothetical protein